MMKKIILGFSLLGVTVLIFLSYNVFSSSTIPGTSEKLSQLKIDRIKGVSFVAPDRPFFSNPMKNIQEINADWIAVIPYGFIPKNDHKVYHGSERQWWGEKTEGVIATIKEAKSAGLKVMLKPQIWMHGYWIGDFTLNDPKKWAEWESTYTEYIMNYTNIAAEYDVDMICIGTEFKAAIQDNKAYWYDLIDHIRSVYKGPLTYSANWDEYQDIPFWNHLDYIGISAYFPLTQSQNPTADHLLKKWKPISKDMKKFSKKMKRPILFTEYGYMSVPGCTGKTWELENNREKYETDEEAQAQAYECLYQAFSDEEWWAGGFLWKWYPNYIYSDVPYYQKDYTPQKKLAEQTISKWYKKM